MPADTHDSPTPRRLAQEVARIIREMTPGLLRATGVPGLSACVADPFGPVDSIALGVREIGTDLRIDLDTVFQIGSVSKAISAVGLVRLVTLGCITLDEPILPRLRSWTFPRRILASHDPSALTMRHLLCHFSGLNVHGYPYLPLDSRLPSAAEILDGIDGPEYALDFLGPPGRTMHYSSANYVLLQLLAEDLTGEPFARWMHRTYLAPLGMHRSSYLWSHGFAGNFARRHTGEGQALPTMQRAVLASSNLHTTPTDLARVTSLVLAARFGNHDHDWFMPPDLAAEMIRGQPDAQSDPHWGLGWYLGFSQYHSTFKAGGAFEGVWSWLEGFPSCGVSVVMLTNSQSGQDVTRPIMERVRPLLLPQLTTASA
jgi:CubicO group peptidase (beta-lactamase class C family)